MTSIDPTARVAGSAVIGKDVSIGPYAVIGPDVVIGDGCEIHGHVNIAGRTELGARNRVFPFASLGTEPQSVHYKGEPTRLTIGADGVFRENVTVNIGTAGGRGVTVIGERCFMMAGAHVAHDCVVGDNVTFANNATLGGHAEIGDNVFLGGLCAVHQFTRVGELAMVGGLVGVTSDVIPYAMVIGHRGNLAGINRVGLRRRGVSAEAIRNIYRGYRTIFDGAGPLRQRVDNVAGAFADDAHVMRMVDFIRTAKARRIAVPRRGGGGDDED
jgi:UDP-N-acetylglucosamine acyltransferase